VYPPYPPPPVYEPWLWKLFILVGNDYILPVSYVLIIKIDVRVLLAAFVAGLLVLVSMAAFHKRDLENK
jgi:hypothetical protein